MEDIELTPDDYKESTKPRLKDIYLQFIINIYIIFLCYIFLLFKRILLIEFE